MSEGILDRSPRRAFLAGVFGGVAGLAASALGRPGAVLAATDANAIHKNVNNPTSGQTTVTSSGSNAITGVTSAQNRSGVLGVAGSQGRGISGLGPIGVYGGSSGPQGRGMVGESTSGSGSTIGVFGRSMSGGGSGVSGLNTAAVGDAVGVKGESTHGAGVVGKGGFLGVDAEGGSIGIEAKVTGNDTGYAGFFAGPANGFGAWISGRLEFDNCGTVTIGAGSGSTSVTPAGPPLKPNPVVLCTLMSSAGAGVSVQHVVANAGANTLTIALTANASAPAQVAYFICYE